MSKAVICEALGIDGKPIRDEVKLRELQEYIQSFYSEVDTVSHDLYMAVGINTAERYDQHLWYNEIDLEYWTSDRGIIEHSDRCVQQIAMVMIFEHIEYVGEWTLFKELRAELFWGDMEYLNIPKYITW